MPLIQITIAQLVRIHPHEILEPIWLIITMAT